MTSPSPSSARESADSRPSAVKAPADRSSRKWISARIAELDAVEDYAEIIRLSMTFQHSGFFFDWIAAQSMPRFSTTPSAPAIYRGGKGKLMATSDRRLHDTANHAMVWGDYGVDSPEAAYSIDMVNALHAKYAKEYPAAFADDELWAYVVAWDVCGLSVTLNRCLGLPHPDEKARTALAIFGVEVVRRLTYVDGTPLPEKFPHLMTYTYDDWVDCLNAYESRTWPYSHDAAMCAQTVLQFFERRFPAPLRPFGRALVTSFWYDGLLAGNGVKPPSAPMRWLACAYLKVLMSIGPLLPDSKESWAEHQKRLEAETGKPMTHVLKVVQNARRPAGGCPAGFTSENPAAGNPAAGNPAAGNPAAGTNATG